MIIPKNKVTSVGGNIFLNFEESFSMLGNLMVIILKIRGYSF